MGEQHVGWDDEQDIPVLIDEHQDRSVRAVWRVVVHERNAGGWWAVAPERYLTWAAAQQHAMAVLRPGGGCSNAGVYPEVDGVVQVPGWIKVREGAGT